MTDPTCAGLFPEPDGTSDRPLVWDDRSGVWRTADDIRGLSLRLAQRIERPGKQLVFLLATNAPETLVGLLAAAAAGHAVALIDPTLSPDRLDDLVRDYRPELVIGTVAGALCQPGDWNVAPSDGVFPEIAARIGATGPSDIHPDLGLLLLTSGTTGSSKFVRLSWAAVTANARQIAASLAITRESVAIAHLPFHYSYGLSVITSHLAMGARIAFIDDALTSPTFWDKVADCGGSHFPGVPFHYRVLTRLGLDRAPSSVTCFTQAGGHLEALTQTAMIAASEKRGARFYVMYGQTEASPRMSCVPSDRLLDKLGSVGLAMPGGRLSIIDGEGRPLPAGETGGVVYEGPNVMMGYATCRTDLSLGDTTGGRIETGDLGRLDAEGFLFLSGRAARFAKIAGLRLSLDDMERQLAVLGTVACLDLGERIAVVFEGDVPEGAKEQARTLALACKIPAATFQLRALPEIPRKTSGKMDYARAKEALNV